MSKSNIGGLFVSLGLDVDKGSFDTGNKLIDNVGNSCNKLIGSARNATNVLSTLTVEVSKIGGATYKTAQQFGMTTDALNLWRTTARMATNDTNSLDYALNRLSDVKVGMKTGKDFSGFAQQLAFLGMGYDKLDGKETGKQLQTIFEHALVLKTSGKYDTQYIAKQIQELLGKGAADTFVKIASSGLSVEKYLEAAEKKAGLVTPNDYKNLEAFQNERQELNATIDNIRTLLGSKLAENLKEPLSKLNEWLDENGNKVATAMETLGSAIAKIIEGGITYGEAGISLLAGDKEGAKEILAENNKKRLAKESGVSVEEYKALEEEAKKRAAIISQKIADDPAKAKAPFPFAKKYKNFDDFSPELQEEIIKYLTDYKDTKIGALSLIGGDWTGAPKIKDGIISPGGQVTQVAPDDWVFAARNIGDMARAFIPQNHNVVSAPSEYVINQTFNVSGGNDMPQVLKQQAYMGTQEGLLEIMRQSSERLQLMSGTR